MGTEAYSRPKDFTRAEKAFIEALYRLVQKKTFEEVHVTELLKESGFTKGAFYGRFEDKYDFVRKILTHAGNIHSWYLYRRMEINEAGEGAAQAIYDNTAGLMRFVYQYKSLYSMLIDRKLGTGSFETFFLEYQNPLNETVRDLTEGNISYDAFISYFGINASMLYVMFWKYMDFRMEPEKMTDMIIRFEGDFRKLFESGTKQ